MFFLPASRYKYCTTVRPLVIATQCIDGKLVLPEAVQVLKMASA